jgi:ribonuclease HI
MKQTLFHSASKAQAAGAKLFTDGGARGNPGPAAIGVVLYDAHDQELACLKKYIGETTNNQAEYQALVAGLELALSRQISSIHCYLDSELVVKQIQGLYRVKEPSLKPLADEVKRLRSNFSAFAISHVARKYNARADALVNEALDELQLVVV